MKIAVDKYYEQLREKGFHRFLFSPLDKYKGIIWIVLIAVGAMVLWDNGFKILSLNEKVFIVLGLLGLFKLGAILGHKEGFLDGYNKGVDDLHSAVAKTKHKKFSLDSALSEVQKEEIRAKI